MTQPTIRPRLRSFFPPNARLRSESRGQRGGLFAFVPIVPIVAWVALSIVLAGCGPLGPERAGDTAPNLSGLSASARDGSDAVALVLEGRDISVAELHEHMQEQFLDELLRQPVEQIFELQESAARELVQKHAIDAEAARRGVTPEALFAEITGAAPEATVEDVTNWYSENQARLRGARLEDVAGQIRDMLSSERRNQAWSEFVKPRLDALDWRLALQPPRRELLATRLVRGKADAPITLMTFSDYQCPYCIRSEPVLAEVLERYPEQVRVIYRHFPLDSIHPFARPAAEAAMCADEQGKYWEYHDAVFAQAGRLDENSVETIGSDLALDLEKFGTCVEERRYQEFVQADFLAGQEAGVTGTPAFFVNGIALKGARNADQLSQIIDTELDRLSAN